MKSPIFLISAFIRFWSFYKDFDGLYTATAYLYIDPSVDTPTLEIVTVV